MDLRIKVIEKIATLQTLFHLTWECSYETMNYTPFHTWWLDGQILSCVHYDMDFSACGLCTHQVGCHCTYLHKWKQNLQMFAQFLCGLKIIGWPRGKEGSGQQYTGSLGGFLSLLRKAVRVFHITWEGTWEDQICLLLGETWNYGNYGK